MSDAVRYHEVEAKSLLRRSVVVDPWFLGRFGSNLYRGCEHGCAYCDGRAERYYVPGTFDRDIQVKHNALDLAQKEIARLREPGLLFIGGGVCDAYQPAEARYQLTRGLLELCCEKRIPVHVLTKSTLVERDLDLLAAIQKKSRAILSFSIATTNEQHREIFEPGAAPLAERWRLIKRAKDLGLAVGVMAMPLLPGLSDSPESVNGLVEKAHDHQVDFLPYGGLTLRPGIQRDGYLKLIERAYPQLLPGYHRLFRSNAPSGMPDPRYLERLDGRCRAALALTGIPGRMPRHLFRGLIPIYTEVAVLLEHRGYAEGEPGGGHGRLARAGWAISQWARDRLSRQRSRDAYRLVEAEFAMVIRTRQFQEISTLDPAVSKSVEEIFTEVSR